MLHHSRCYSNGFGNPDTFDSRIQSTAEVNVYVLVA